MANTSETGYAKNSANFEQMISNVIGCGTAYNPSKAAIKLPAQITSEMPFSTDFKEKGGSIFS